MSDDPDPEKESSRSALRRIGRDAERKREARAKGDRGIWFGFGMFGLVGWSVAVPTLAGVALGLWLDAGFGGHGSLFALTAAVGIVAVAAFVPELRRAASA